jgi:hypothetical protein
VLKLLVLLLYRWEKKDLEGVRVHKPVKATLEDHGCVIALDDVL